jgi:predicted acylesterase/phospholipase RssA
MIKHLVISGGGPIMIQLLGVFKTLFDRKYIDINEIESIYATSAGAIVATLLCLKYDDLNVINDYVIKRPWNDVFKIRIEDILESYKNKGIFNIRVIEKCFKPLFEARDININITLKEFYEYSNVELHFYSFEINSFQIEDISYLTHPNITLLESIYMTCTLPIIVSPICINNKCFIDGGIICNYPLKYCIDSGKNKDEILGFKNKYTTENANTIIGENSTLLDFIMSFLFKIIHSFSTSDSQPDIPNELICNTNLMNITLMKETLNNITIRQELFNLGIKEATDYLIRDVSRTP